MMLDQLGEQLRSSDNPLAVVVTGPNNAKVKSPPIINQPQSGICQVAWYPDTAGQHVVAVIIKRRHIVGRQEHLFS
jgi:hypothetical protein